jgi:hypothetical protein
MNMNPWSIQEDLLNVLGYVSREVVLSAKEAAYYQPIGCDQYPFRLIPIRFPGRHFHSIWSIKLEKVGFGKQIELFQMPQKQDSRTSW